MLRGWLERQRVFRELRGLEVLEAQFLALDDSNPLHQAKVALGLGHHKEAARQLAAAQQRYPAYVSTSEDTVDLLVGLRLFDEAERLTRERIKAHPRDPRHLADHALISHRRGDADEAMRRWAYYRRRFPARWDGYIGKARILRETGRLGAAAETINRAITISPDALVPRLEAASLAEAREDWESALERWKCVDERFHDLAGALGVARALEKLGRFQDAIERLQPIHYSHPSLEEVSVSLMRLERRRAEAANRPEGEALAADADVQQIAAPMLLRHKSNLLRKRRVPKMEISRWATQTGEALRDRARTFLAKTLRGLPNRATPRMEPTGSSAGATRPTLRLTNRYTWLPRHWFLTQSNGTAGLWGTAVVAVGCSDDFEGVRIGFCNISEVDFVIPLAKACASDAWHDYANPTGSGEWVTLAASSGDDSPGHGYKSACHVLTVAGNGPERAAGFPNLPRWTWTDWASVRSGEPDPATGMRVVIIRHLANAGESYTYAGGMFSQYRGNLEYNHGYDYAVGGYNNGTDHVTIPDEMWGRAVLENSMVNGSMVAAIQLMTKRLGIVGMNCGDGQHSGTTTLSEFNNYLAQAMTSLGHRYVGKFPCSFVVCARSGAAGTDYFAWLKALLPTVQPSFVVLPGWEDSVGLDPAEPVDGGVFFTELKSAIVTCASHGALPIVLTPFPIDALAAAPERKAAWDAARLAVLAMRIAGTIVIDAADILGNQMNGLLDGTYKCDCTVDNLHPNDVGHAMLADALIAVIESLVDLDAMNVEDTSADGAIEKIEAPAGMSR